MRMLDICSGQFGWGRVFAARGWEVVGIDLNPPADLPEGCSWWERNAFGLDADFVAGFDFACASTSCEQFSVHGMKHFHPNPPYPELGIKLFNHTRSICEASGVPYVMENVRAAQQFVGDAANHCGPFYLWGNAVPLLLPQGIQKGISQRVPGINSKTRAEITAWRRLNDPMWSSSKSHKRIAATALAATIPPELANCVAAYAERICQVRA